MSEGRIDDEGAAARLAAPPIRPWYSSRHRLERSEGSATTFRVHALAAPPSRPPPIVEGIEKLLGGARRRAADGHRPPTRLPAAASPSTPPSLPEASPPLGRRRRGRGDAVGGGARARDAGGFARRLAQKMENRPPDKSTAGATMRCCGRPEAGIAVLMLDFELLLHAPGANVWGGFACPQRQLAAHARARRKSQKRGGMRTGVPARAQAANSRAHPGSAGAVAACAGASSPSDARLPPQFRRWPVAVPSRARVRRRKPRRPRRCGATGAPPPPATTGMKPELLVQRAGGRARARCARTTCAACCATRRSSAAQPLAGVKSGRAGDRTRASARATLAMSDSAPRRPRAPARVAGRPDIGMSGTAFHCVRTARRSGRWARCVAVATFVMAGGTLTAAGAPTSARPKEPYSVACERRPAASERSGSPDAGVPGAHGEIVPTSRMGCCALPSADLHRPAHRVDGDLVLHEVGQRRRLPCADAAGAQFVATLRAQLRA